MVIDSFFRKTVTVFRTDMFNYMACRRVRPLVLALAVMAASVLGATAQTRTPKPLEVSEADGVPVIVKHLPDADNVGPRAKFINSTASLREVLGERPILKTIDFSGGTEAAVADYPAGKLLIVEYTNPQGSIDADQNILQAIAHGGADVPTAYRRIGNYNTFVFDGSDEAAAMSLLDQIKYEKSVQWLGEDPFLLKRVEKYFVTTTRDIFISTVIVIVLGIGGSILAGIIAGLVYFRFRDNRRERTAAFSDAGGLTRLNIDDLTSEVAAD